MDSSDKMKSLKYKSLKRYMKRYSFKLEPFKGEDKIRRVFDIRRKPLRDLLLASKSDLIDDFLLVISHKNLFKKEDFVYANNKTYNLKLVEKENDFTHMAEFHEKMMNMLGMSEVDSCGYFPKKDKYYLLLRRNQKEVFLSYALADNINNSSELEKIVESFGSTCLKIAETGYLYSTDLNKYTAEKINGEWEILPSYFLMKKYNPKINTLAFRDLYYNKIKENLEINGESYYNSFCSGFHRQNQQNFKKD